MLTRRGCQVAGAAAAVLALGGAGAAVAWHESAGNTHHAQTVSAYCGLVACAVLHSGDTAPADSVPVTGQPSGRAQVSLRTSPTPAASASSPAPVTVPTPGPTTAPTPTPVPAPGPSPTPPAPTPTPPGPSPTPPSAAVTVTYSTPQQWPGGFQGELTIVNQGSAAVTGWQIVLTLPGDWVQTVWNANWQPDGWGTVIMTPTPGDQVIEPGTTLSVGFIAQGNTTEPANCTFNGSPCS